MSDSYTLRLLSELYMNYTETSSLNATYVHIIPANWFARDIV